MQQVLEQSLATLNVNYILADPKTEHKRAKVHRVQSLWNWLATVEDFFHNQAAKKAYAEHNSGHADAVKFLLTSRFDEALAKQAERDYNHAF